MFRKISSIVLCLVLIGSQYRAQAGVVKDRDITTPCAAHLGSLVSTEPHDYEHYFEFTKVPGAAAQFANEKLPNTVATIAIAPVTPEEYKVIFTGKNDKNAQSITMKQRKEVQNVQSALKSKLGRNAGARTFTEKGYKSAITAEKASYIIVIGHNEQGMLRLLDGNYLFLDDVVRGAGPNQRIILISCDSASQVSDKRSAATINRKVTYEEAFDIAGRISAFITNAGRRVSLSEVQSQLTKDVSATQRKHKIAFFVMKALCAGGTAIIVALILRELDPCDDKKSSDCNK